MYFEIPVKIKYQLINDYPLLSAALLAKCLLLKTQ
jgi:hypothetical protein